MIILWTQKKRLPSDLAIILQIIFGVINKRAQKKSEGF